MADVNSPIRIDQVANGYIVRGAPSYDNTHAGFAYESTPHVFETFQGLVAHLEKHFAREAR